MAFTVETGTGSPSATSYCSVAYADTFCAKNKRLAATWAALSTANKEYRLETATEIIDRDCYFDGYPRKFIGTASDRQRLQWPRYDVYDRNGYSVDSDSIPEDLQRATAQLAAELQLKDLDKEFSREVESMSTGQGAFSVSFREGMEPRVLVRSVLSFLKPYLTNAGASIGKMVR
jgi:hypothetical protein